MEVAIGRIRGTTPSVTPSACHLPRRRRSWGGLENGVAEERRNTVSLPYNHKLIPRAKELRKDATEQEKSLWYKYLSQYPIRFQRKKQSEDLLRIFIAQRLNWRLNWTAASIFRTKERHMMKAERPVLKNMESLSSVFPTPKLIDILNPCVK